MRLRECIGALRAVPPSPGLVSARLQEIDALMNKHECPECNAAALQQLQTEREAALVDAGVVQEAVSKRQMPPFTSLWALYKYNRPVAYGLLPDENKCAVVMSLTLGLEPGPDEMSLGKLGNPTLVSRIVHAAKSIYLHQTVDRPQTNDAMRDTAIADRYYLKAQDMANRLMKEWGPPAALDGRDARNWVSGKRGVIFSVTRISLDMDIPATTSDSGTRTILPTARQHHLSAQTRYGFGRFPKRVVCSLARLSARIRLLWPNAYRRHRCHSWNAVS